MMATYALLWNFTIGGLTGVFLSDVPVDEAFHGTMFVTAHFHYTLMGGALTGALGALAFWFPKMTGRMLDERLGIVAFWLTQVGFNVTFLGMFFVGLEGQPRRVADFQPIFATGNMVSTIGAYTIGVGMLILLYAVVSSWLHGEVASSNPWGSKTLEWQVPTPVPLENFSVLPVVTSDFYGYGEPETGNGSSNGHRPEQIPVVEETALEHAAAVPAGRPEASSTAPDPQEPRSGH
jgi:cytochrome c oxidase subunit 1